MVTFDVFAKRFGRLPAFIRKEGKKILKANEKMIVDMQVAQDHAGINELGEQIQSGYSGSYGKRRTKKGLQISFVDKHFTGKMHKGKKIVPVKGGIDLRSKEPYEFYVRAMFPRSWGLTKPNAEVVAELVAVRLAVEMKKFLVG
ncbi:MAG: hypothetical protein V3V88_00430 [Dehalococcoidia bacterium]